MEEGENGLALFGEIYNYRAGAERVNLFVFFFFTAFSLFWISHCSFLLQHLVLHLNFIFFFPTSFCSLFGFHIVCFSTAFGSSFRIPIVRLFLRHFFYLGFTLYVFFSTGFCSFVIHIVRFLDRILLIFNSLFINARAYLRDWWSFLEAVFVGQCEVFVLDL